MPASLLALPSELRTVIYQLVLVQDKPIYPALLLWNASSLGLQPFPVNKLIRHETIAIFYGENCFVSGTETYDIVTGRSMMQMLQGIGQSHAGYIRSIRISLLDLLVVQHHQLAIVVDDDLFSAYFRSVCTDLREMVISCGDVASLEAEVSRQNRSQVFSDILALLDRYIRAASNASEISIATTSSVSSKLEQKIQTLGWKVKLRVKDRKSERYYSHDFIYESDGSDVSELSQYFRYSGD